MLFRSQKTALENVSSLLAGERWVELGSRLQEQQVRLRSVSAEMVESERLLVQRKEELDAKAKADEFFSESFKLLEAIRQTFSAPQHGIGSLSQMTSRCAAIESAGRMVDGRSGGGEAGIRAR